MQITFVSGFPPESSYPGMRLYDGNGNLVATVNKVQPITLTKELFEQIPVGSIFKTVVTHLQNVHESFSKSLKFVCIRVDWDWKIYCHHVDKPDAWIAKYGDKVHGEETIRSICPCENDVYKLYGH